VTKRLELAFEEAAKLPEGEQENFADFLLAELHDEARWQAAFAKRPDVLASLADEARREHLEGKTEPLENLLN
jgi:hypothetical protein